MRPTAEGLEEQNRDKPKPESRPEPREAEQPAEPAAAPAPFPAPPFERYAETPEPIWQPETAAPAPLFVETVESATLPGAPFAREEAPFEEPRFDEDDDEDEDDEDDEDPEGHGGAEELGAAGTASEGDEKEGESPAAAESRRRRSRGRRGGRRRNGRADAAAPVGQETAGTEDGEDEKPRPVFEEPAPVAAPLARRRGAPPVHAPAHSPAHTPAAAPSPGYRMRGTDSYVINPSELEGMTREIIISVPDRQRSAGDERKIALFCDFENIALGVRDSEIGKFEITLILERLLEKGKIIVKKAYADWERYSDYKRPFHEAAIELIDIPQKFYSGKNSADIKMVVDAMDLSYSKEHLDTFVILSGDSDFSPLVSKLKENNKYVIGIGVKNSSSNLLVDNCDEFIYYEDVWRDSQKGPKLDGLNKKTAEAFSLMIESIQALVRENKDVLWGSMIKQTMQRKKPSFNEGYYGYSTFSELLEDAERKQIIKLKKDQRSGTYIVTGFAKTGETMAPAAGRR
ncbi:MAG TPA: NYN domain-containing protein [Thermoanaerobaculia bacterium]|nr:NYN domain-containing protein [Thermoanaerobaculia bacterium]